MFVLAYTYSYKLRSQFIITPVLQLDIGKIKDKTSFQCTSSQRGCWTMLKPALLTKRGRSQDDRRNNVYNPLLHAAVSHLNHKYFPSHKFTQITVVFDGYCILNIHWAIQNVLWGTYYMIIFRLSDALKGLELATGTIASIR